MCTCLQRSGVSKLMSVVLSVFLGRERGGRCVFALSSSPWCMDQGFSSVQLEFCSVAVGWVWSEITEFESLSCELDVW